MFHEQILFPTELNICLLQAYKYLMCLSILKLVTKTIYVLIFFIALTN